MCPIRLLPLLGIQCRDCRHDCPRTQVTNSPAHAKDTDHRWHNARAARSASHPAFYDLLLLLKILFWHNRSHRSGRIVERRRGRSTHTHTRAHTPQACTAPKSSLMGKPATVSAQTHASTAVSHLQIFRRKKDRVVSLRTMLCCVRTASAAFSASVSLKPPPACKRWISPARVTPRRCTLFPRECDMVMLNGDRLWCCCWCCCGYVFWVL